MKRVFVSGCFDLFHYGHVEFLRLAKAQGDWLIVSVARDATVKALKREPIYPEAERLEIVRACRYVNEAFLAYGETSEHDYLSYLKALRPEFWVVGGDDACFEEKREISAQLAIRIVTVPPRVQNVHVTQLLEKIRARA